MPLGPDSRIQIRMEVIKPMIDGIDNKIRNTPTGKEIEYPCMDKELTEYEIEYINNQYKNVGWDVVQYMTSLKNGERGGLARWTLRMFDETV